MQCEHAYVKDGARYILCRKSEKPETGDQRAEAHAMCGFQRFCPNIRACVLLPGWEGCLRRRESREEAAQAPQENRKGAGKGRRKKTAQKA